MRTVPPDAIPGIWAEVRDNILKALKRSMGRWAERDILLSLLADPNWTLWVHDNATVVTRIVGYPRSIVCEIILAGGEKLEAWAQYEALISDWAREKGCKQIEMYGREGWERVKTQGWEKTGIRMTKDLSHG